MATRKRSTSPAKGGAKKSRARAKKKSAGFPWVKFLLALVLLGALAGVAGITGIFWWYSRDLPTLNSVADYQPKQVSRVVDREGNVLASWTDEERLVRTVLPQDDIPLIMRQAILSAEDSSFYSHRGLDFVGLLRAVYTNVRRGELSQGASTITQQVVKNLVLSPERSIRRKVQEAILAWQLDANLAKDDILTIYLNEVFFGVHFYGVEEATQYYFGHSARDLTLPEAALIAGLVQSPNRYNPYRHPDRALERRRYVLRRLYEEGHIEEGVYREALEAPLGLVPPEERRPHEGNHPYYVDAVRRALLTRFDEATLDTGGLRVVTALDLQTQQAAEGALQRGLRDFDGRHGFHTPFRTLESDADVARWRKDNEGGASDRGLVPDQDYRAVIVRSDDDATIMAIGPYVVTLDRQPVSRMRPDPKKSWAQYFPVRAVFTVRPQRAYASSELSTEDPSTARVRLMPPAQGAAVVMNVATREVLGLAGGYAFSESPYNRAVQARRQTGSTFKAFVYAGALDARIVTPATLLEDQPLTVRQPGGQTWQPQNYDGQFRGSMTLRTALALSRNVVAVRVLELLGLPGLRSFLDAMGLTFDIPDSLTVALGSAELTPLEMTNAVSVFASQGQRGTPVFVREVFDSHGKSVWKQSASIQPGVDARVAWLTTSMLRSVVERGTGRAARKLPFQVAGKTGSTNQIRDAWFTGYSSTLAASVWIGYDNNTPLGRKESGGSTALPIWVDLMRAAHEGRKPADFPPPPEGVVMRNVDEATGLLTRPGGKGVDEYFLVGTEPRTFAPSEDDRDVQDTLLRGGGAQDSLQPGFDDGGF